MARESFERSSRLLDVHAWFESSDQIEKETTPRVVNIEPRLRHVMHHHRNPQGGARPQVGSGEAFGRNSDDGEIVAIQRNRFSDQARIAAEAALPQGGAEHNDRMRSRS